ncbi:MAG: ribonuclease HII [Thermodesulfobacteriota bacterium]|nr:ribonuclease HII [Thermodesulfobacteriota bacterium]
MTLEEDFASRGRAPVCGIDEAGRGPLAGPVVAAAVIMSPDSGFASIVRDSKRLTPRKREEIFEQLTKSEQVCFGVASVDAKKIDRVNILQATLMAMKDAVSMLNIAPGFALVDGNTAPDLACECLPVIRGDVTEPVISAASIIAKVTRDRYMVRMDEVYPGWGFASHKGYPVRAHYDAIARLGICPIHRRSFKGVEA